MLPVSFTAAYVVVWLVCRWKKQAVRIVVLVAALGTIALSGQKIYSKATFTEQKMNITAAGCAGCCGYFSRRRCQLESKIGCTE